MNIIPLKIPGVRHIIGVASGKGGVGKTFFATNLAVALSKMGQRTGLLDADISCPNVFKMLGITHKFVPTSDTKLIPVEKYGVKIISMAGLMERENDPIVWRGPIISKILQQFLKESIWGELDALVVDFPTGTGDIPLTLMQNFALSNLLVVTTPQQLSVMDAEKMLGMATMLKVPMAGIIENMRGDIFGEGGGSSLAERWGISCLGSIPMRKQITSFCDQGMPPILQMDEVSMLIGKIARGLMEKNLAQ